MANSAEEFVADLCGRTFLSLWSVANPVRPDGKELCDLLVICSPDVLVISVKEVVLRGDGMDAVAAERWIRRAVKNSIKQIHGAERYLDSLPPVVTRVGGTGLPIPGRDTRRVHRIAVAFGANRAIPIHAGDDGRGLVHVFDEIALPLVLQELDTITDFVEYLEAKDALLSDGRTVLASSEEDLLAVYLANGHRFPVAHADIINVVGGWEAFGKLPEVREKKRLDRTSYVWDALIEALTKPGAQAAALAPDADVGPWAGPALDTQLDNIARVMAREVRFARRLLGREFSDFLLAFKAKKIRSRLMLSPSGVLYVFLGMEPGEDVRIRHAELVGRCLVARSLNPDAYPLLIGIALAPDEDGGGMPLDAVRFEVVWNEELQREAMYAQKEFGWFRNAVEYRSTELEYPPLE